MRCFGLSFQSVSTRWHNALLSADEIPGLVSSHIATENQGEWALYQRLRVIYGYDIFHHTLE